MSGASPAADTPAAQPGPWSDVAAQDAARLSAPLPAPAPRASRPARPRTLSCPNCGGSIQVRAAGLSISAACASCGSVVDVANEDLRIIGEAQQRTRQPELAIGARGELAGVTWEVVGYQVRSNPAEGWSWEEYLLFSPYYGFRFLSHDDEGWTLYCMLRGDVPDPESGPGDGRRYEALRTGTAHTDYVLGEFYWRVRVGDTVTTKEYASPPYVLSREEGGQEIVWSRGIGVPDAAVRRAFLGGPHGAAAGKDAQPAASLAARRARTWGVLATAAAAVLLLVVLHAVPFGRHRAETVFTQSFQASAANRGQAVATEPFTIPDAGGNLRILVQSPIRDGRLLLSLSLAGGDQARTFDAAGSIENYASVRGGPAGALHGTSAFFASVPGGEYRLLVEATALAASEDQGIPFTVTVQRHVPAGDFFWLGLAALLAYPFCHVVAGLWRGTLLNQA